MRLTAKTWMIVSCLWIVSGAVAPAKGADETFKAEGKWKLVVASLGDFEFVIIDVANDNGQIRIKTVSVQDRVGEIAAKSLEVKGTSVKLVMDASGSESTFTGNAVLEGKEHRVMGLMRLRGNSFPARLERTNSDKVALPLGNPVMAKIFAIRQLTDAKARVKALEAILADQPGPSTSQARTTLLQTATDAELSEKQVGEQVQAWLNAAQPYGEDYVADCRLAALQALASQKTFAVLSLDLAQQADKALTATSTTEQQVAVIKAFAMAAKAADKPELATESQTRLAKLESKLDEEYLATVPPFKPEAYAGRPEPRFDRVVMLELFTGAQCPPCVAADVAFDALLKAYKPTDLIGLQYHLHIPGPDPLTNADSEARAQYYAVRGTPSTYFNGAVGAPGGGGMGNAIDKHTQYRELIDEQLQGARDAKLELKVTRQGNKVIVAAGAKVETKKDATEKKSATDADAKDASESKLRLRLALTEESIRYVGGNRLRFHHHVVRGFPGGVTGTDIASGECQANVTIDLDELRTQQDEYLGGAQRFQGLSNVLPEMALKHLSVVAFVQDDSDKRVLHAISADVPEE